jgi:hypothetical protein
MRTAAIKQPALPVLPPEFFTAVKKICMTHLEVPGASDDLKARVTAFEGLVVQELAGHGFELVDADTVEKSIEETTRRSAGCYDAFSGQRDEACFSRVRLAAMQALGDGLGCNAVATSEFAVVQSPWSNEQARWDGVRAEMDGELGAYGTVGALSFLFTLEDTKGNRIYFRSGGIQVLSGLGSEGLFSPSKFTDVPSETLLANEARNRGGIIAALKPLLVGRLAHHGSAGGS